MSFVRPSSTRVQCTTALCVWTALFSAACTTPDSTTPTSERVQVRIDSMGVAGVAPLDLGIYVNADRPAWVAPGNLPPHALVDTVRLRSTPSFTPDVTDGAVHVEFVDGQLGGGGGGIRIVDRKGLIPWRRLLRWTPKQTHGSFTKP